MERAPVETIAATDKAVARSVIRNLDLRILLPLAVPLFLTVIDRLNIAIAALQMNQALAISATMFGFISGIFFVGYALSALPGNIIGLRVGVGRWMAFLMMGWGLTSVGFSVAQQPTHVLALRFLLGVAEGAFSPAMLYWLSLWYPDRDRGRALSLLVIPQCAATLLSGPVGGLIMAVHPMDGWRVLFLMEGLPTILLGLLWLRLPDQPHRAAWLQGPARDWLLRTLDEEVAAKRAAQSQTSFATMLKTSNIWVFCLTWIFFQAALSGMISWLPQIMSAVFSDRLSDFKVGLLTALPSALGIIFALILSTVFERFPDRRRYLVAMPLAAALSLFATTWTGSPLAQIACLSIALGMCLPLTGVFWSIPLAIYTGSAAAGAVALISVAGTLGAFAAPPLMGYLRSATGSFETSLLVPLAASLVMALFPLLCSGFRLRLQS